jgi:hypothetical protein
MKKHKAKVREIPMRKECDFSGGIRGKYAKRFSQGSNIVVLDPSVARVFTDSDSVNQALKALSEIFQRQKKKASA